AARSGGAEGGVPPDGRPRRTSRRNRRDGTAGGSPGSGASSPGIAASAATARPRGPARSERGGEPIVRGVEGLGEYPRVADHGHEVRVPVPARDHVEVEVSEYAGTGNASLVGAQVEPVGVIGAPQRPYRGLHEVHGLAQLVRSRLLESPHVARHYGHDVARGVRELVEDQEREGSAAEDESASIIAGREGVAE